MSVINYSIVIQWFLNNSEQKLCSFPAIKTHQNKYEKKPKPLPTKFKKSIAMEMKP